MIILMVTFFCGLVPTRLFCEDIEVSIKGVDDGIRTTKQRDYQEALMNAKLQAVERAGVEITSVTKIEDFQLKYDTIESKSKAILLPGFQIMDIGYQPDGTYLVILIGKVRTQSKGTVSREFTAKAYRALKRIEANTQTGVNYKDYSNQVGDAKLEFTLFLESPESKEKPELTEALSKAMQHYEAAKAVWDRRFSYGFVANYLPIKPLTFPKSDTSRMSKSMRELVEESDRKSEKRELERQPEFDANKLLLKPYPEADKAENEGGVLVGRDGMIDVDRLIKIIWARASEELKKVPGL